MSISDAQAKVREFHEKFGVSSPRRPLHSGEVNWPTHDRRLNWVIDEVHEGKNSCSVADLADAYVDIIVFALGGLTELGVDSGPLFDAVMAANMTKVKLPGVAKIAKPLGFVHPDIAALIEAQRNGK